jgi:hypothetical protein
MQTRLMAIFAALFAAIALIAGCSSKSEDSSKALPDAATLLKESSDTTKGIQPLVEHWDGTKWSVAPSPTFRIPPAEGEMDPISASASLFGVAIQSGGRPWAVGQKPAGHGAAQQPLIEAACHPA